MLEPWSTANCHPKITLQKCQTYPNNPKSYAPKTRHPSHFPQQARPKIVPHVQKHKAHKIKNPPIKFLSLNRLYITTENPSTQTFHQFHTIFIALNEQMLASASKQSTDFPEQSRATNPKNIILFSSLKWSQSSAQNSSNLMSTLSSIS